MKSANASPVPVGLAGFWVAKPLKAQTPWYCLLSVKWGIQRRIFVPPFRMWRPRMSVTLSVHSKTFRSWVLGRWSKADPLHVAVAAPAEVGEGADDAGAAGLLEALDSGFLEVVRAQAERLQVDDLRQVAEAELVQQRRGECARQRRDEVLAARVEVRARPSSG